MGPCHGPTETYFSHCGRYSSTLDYIFLLNCLSEKIVSAKTLGMHVDNSSNVLHYRAPYVQYITTLISRNHTSVQFVENYILAQFDETICLFQIYGKYALSFTTAIWLNLCLSPF